jgi:hypothetical protein
MELLYSGKQLLAVVANVSVLSVLFVFTKVAHSIYCVHYALAAYSQNAVGYLNDMIFNLIF